MNFSVTKNGKKLDETFYTWDEKTKTFSSNESNLVLDFSDIDGVTFDTRSDCTFKTGSDCTFDTGYDCTFDTGSYCTFKTGSECTFKTGSGCVVVRRDVFEVIILEEEENHIKLNNFNVQGYENIKENHVIEIDGKKIQLSKESYENLKKSLL